MAKIGLQSARIVALVGQRIAAGVPQHVRVCLKGQFDLPARALDHAGEACGAEGVTAFRGEHVGRFGLLLALEPPQRPQLVPKDRMGAWCPLLDPADMQSCRGELHLIPAQVHQFGDAQAMPVGHKDHGGVPVSPAVALSRSHQPLDFGFGQVLAGAQVAIGRPPGRNCSVYGGPRDEPEVPFGHVFQPSRIDDCSYNARSSNS